MEPYFIKKNLSTGEVDGLLRGATLDWKDIAKMENIYLNLGGGPNHHPNPEYINYISVDLDASEGWSVNHDLRAPIPLPDNSVDRIHSEDFLEHISKEDAVKLLDECYRLLKSDGLMRIGVPDYENIKDRFCLKLGHDPRFATHVTLTTYDYMRDLLTNHTKFKNIEFYHWDGKQFVRKPIDYSLGIIKRTLDNDPRCRVSDFREFLKSKYEEIRYLITHGFRISNLVFLSLPHHKNHITSIVADLRK